MWRPRATPRATPVANARGARYGGNLGVIWNRSPTPAGAWGAPTRSDIVEFPSDVAFLADRVVVARPNLVIGHGVVSGVQVDTHDLRSGALVDVQVWEPGSYTNTYDRASIDAPVLAHDGARVYALRPRSTTDPASSVTLFSGPGSAAPLPGTERSGAFAAAVGPGRRVSVVEEGAAVPGLQVRIVEGAAGTPPVWSRPRDPRDDGRGEMGIRALGDDVVLAFWESHDLVVTVIDREGRVRASSPLPVHVPPTFRAAIELAAGGDGTFAVLWTAVDSRESSGPGRGGIARFRACGP